MENNLGDLYAATGHFVQELEQYRKTLQIDPKYPDAHNALAEVYFAHQKYSEAFAAWKQYASDTGDADTIHRWDVVLRKFQASGHLAAMRTLAELQIEASVYIPPSIIAGTYFAAEEKERGFGWLERAYHERDDNLEFIKVDPIFAPFRSDPRYADLLRRMGLPQ